jgi:hypothetical protein
VLVEENARPSRIRAALDFLALIAPIICLVDCVVIPAVLMLLPLMGIHQIYHGVSDQILLLLVLAICTPAVTSGFLKHRNKSVLVLMGLGFGLMFFANLAGHVIDDSVHFCLTALGSFFLIKANLTNKRLSKHACCGHNHAQAIVQVPIDKN